LHLFYSCLTFRFQPLTGLTAEKHDSFLGIDPRTGKAFSTFKGKLLIGGEADGSSFPSGGLRDTPIARAYTIWDPQTPAFLMMENGVPTLCIPTCLYSFDGSALDKKTPMLRSQMALEDAAHRLFEALGDKTHTHIHTYAGQFVYLVHFI
jgi:glutamine synthetase